MTIYKNDAHRFETLYYQLYLFIVNDYKNRTGKALKPYKEYEPNYLKQLYVTHEDKEEMIDQVSELTSKLIIIQALPNANHRTAFLFIKYYLKKQGIDMKIYKEAKIEYDAFYQISKEVIDKDINHERIFSSSYFDIYHTSGIEKHKKNVRILMENILNIPQSGMRTVESFHSFVASMNQAGSLPFSNQ
jgi:prophage maintenance system killer protein